MDSVTQLIMQVCEHVDREYLEGKLGGVFLEMVERRTAQQESQQQELKDADIEFIEKVKFLRECEKKSDLGWIDYPSWRTLNSDFQTQFEQTTNPLFVGSGVYFCWTLFFTNIERLVSFSCTNTIIFVLRDNLNFRISCVSANSREYNWYGNAQFNACVDLFNTTLYLSMANTKSGVKIKEFKQQNRGTN